MSTSLEGRIALVTGASRGIGAAIADRLARSGATVVGTATTDAGAAAIGERLRAVSPDSAGRALDVNDADAAAAILADLADAPGAPAILVNNAGVTRDQLLLRMSEDDWADVMDTNLRSVFRLSKACLRGMMKARWGRIVNIGSVVGATGNPGQVNYSAAKAGMGGFSRSLAQEVASRNITVNVVAPGFIDTDMTRALAEGQRDSLLASIPMQRLGSAEDIAAAVAFLASDDAAYITGQTLHVNGGMYMN